MSKINVTELLQRVRLLDNDNKNARRKVIRKGTKEVSLIERMIRIIEQLPKQKDDASSGNTFTIRERVQ